MLFRWLSPHTWGCSGGDQYYMASNIRCPHIRGGVPVWNTRARDLVLLSPHTWGCSYRLHQQPWVDQVVPTYVGVFLRPSSKDCLRPSLSPHTWGCSGAQLANVCSGSVVPTYVGVFLSKLLCEKRKRSLSPHTWGCSYSSVTSISPVKVVPTYVGVFRNVHTVCRCSGSCPHIRGGVPWETSQRCSK